MYQCEHCDKIYSHRQSLFTHNKSHKIERENYESNVIPSSSKSERENYENDSASSSLTSGDLNCSYNESENGVYFWNLVRDQAAIRVLCSNVDLQENFFNILSRN